MVPVSQSVPTADDGQVPGRLCGTSEAQTVGYKKPPWPPPPPRPSLAPDQRPAAPGGFSEKLPPPPSPATFRGGLRKRKGTSTIAAGHAPAKAQSAGLGSSAARHAAEPGEAKRGRWRRMLGSDDSRSFMPCECKELLSLVDTEKSLALC